MHYGDLHAAEESKSFIVYCALWVILGIEQQLIQNSTSLILDELLFESGYDRQIRPQIEGPPLEVLF